MAQSHRKADSDLFASAGLRLINASDCKSCHQMSVRSVGPSYKEVAEKYKGQDMIDKLSEKVIVGGMGVWGEHAMSAHPNISKADAKSMVNYILSLGDAKASNAIGVAGTLGLKKPADQSSSKGVFVVRATYLDKGNKKMAPVQSEKWLFLRDPALNVEKADVTKGILQLITPGRSTNMVGQNPYLGYKDLDLTGISTIEIAASAQARANAAGGVIEIRLDSPTGTVIGQTTAIQVAQGGFGGPPPAAATPGKGAPLGTGVASPAAAAPAAPAAASAAAPAAPAAASAAPAGQRRMAGPAAQKVAIQSTSGSHDLYFVAVNPKATEQQIVVQISGIEMKK
jgi:cytochrome c